MTTHSATHEPIAIIGFSCLFPGATTPDEFWTHLFNGVNTTSPATATHFGADPTFYFDPERRGHDTTYSLRGGYVQAPMAGDLSDLDKASAWSLYVAREGLRHSGYLNRPDVLARCGLILGSLSFPTQESHGHIAPIYTPALENALGELMGIEDFRLLPANDVQSSTTLQSPSTVVVERLGLKGAAFMIDAACASSLYAIGLGCAYLRAGQADIMLTGAVSAADPLFVNMGFKHFGAYPEQGASRPLDMQSGGLIAGEGAGMLVLKRYSDALRDGDTVYAIIGGLGLSNHGRGKHPLTPNSRGQTLAFQRAYADGIDPHSVQYIECHASGTPLGDKTELNSLDEFFGGSAVLPKLGAVKANLGHLLTVAGLASILKVLLSMQHHQIPATIDVEQPLSSGRFGAEQIVRRNTPWTDAHKIAGINAFGFGGVSAHLILQSPSAVATRPAATTSKPRLAIVGMDAQFGGCDGLEAFARTLYAGEQQFIPLPPKRWKGLADDAPLAAYIDSFEIDFLRFKFPPREDDQPTPQHLLLLKVADNALQAAQLPEDGNVAVIVVLETELSLHQYRSRLDLSWQIKDSLARQGYQLEADFSEVEQIAKDALSPPAQVNQYTSYIGNIVSSRVSALWNFSGPAFTLSSAENGVYKALEVAQHLLADEALDAVVIGAVDLAAGVENITLRRAQYPLNTGAVTLSFDQQANGWQPGEGAGAVVIQRADRARGHVYATIESVVIQPGRDAVAIAGTLERALAAAGLKPDAIGYVEASASGIAAQDSAEITGLNRVYPRQGDALRTALGSVKANFGHTGAASGIASLIKTALCLDRRFIPAVPQWSAPKQPDDWAGSAFYVPQESQTWFEPAGVKRSAVISGLGEDGTCAGVVLTEGVTPRAAGSAYLHHKGLYLFPVDADDRDTLMQRLQQLDGDEPLAVLAQRAFSAYRSGRYAAVILARSHEMLRRELQLSLNGIPQAFERGGDWQTPAGSAFSANPVGAGGVAFIYPGGFNSYPGHGRDWMHLFPSSLAYAESLVANVGEHASETLLYPRSLSAPDRAQVRATRAKLMHDQNAMMSSGILFSMLYTKALRDIFQIKPDMSFGYSLGESSMLWAFRVWRDGDSARVTLRNSPLFTTRLYGRKEAIREAWGLPGHLENDFWASFVLSASPAVVLDQLIHETRVYLTHVNTPNEVVIAGDPIACQRVIERLGVEAVRAPFETVIHNEAMLSEYAAFYQLHRRAVYPVEENITFYSAADYEPLRLNSDFVARSVARVSCKQVDFPRLIHNTYRDGARVFIELGPGSTCTRWISDTLRAENREHLAVSIDQLRLDDHTALLKLLARLVSHRVPLNLAALYDAPLSFTERKRLLRVITLGGDPVGDTILSEGNRRFTRQPMRLALREPVFEDAPPVAGGDHRALLQKRLTGLRELASLLQAQVKQPGVGAVMLPVAPPVMPRYTPRRAVFNISSIDQFARGSIKACFGEEYAIYDDRRAPRIPNTDLMLLSRIVEVNGTRLVTTIGSSMVAEYDVPAEQWFYRDNSAPFTPYSMLIEMALQPCGFLSAFMGPTLDYPDIDFYFRNLDGVGKLIREVDLRGRTLVNRVELVSSTILQGIIIQKYTFDMQLDGESFYVGNSTFGYFTKQALSSQAGLDRGKPPAKWHEVHPDAPLVRQVGNRVVVPRHDSMRTLPSGQLAFLDNVLIDVKGGTHGEGYIYAVNRVEPTDWYFACHFHDDPVMPGSLGLETVVQAMQAYALEAGLGQEMRAPRFALVEDREMVWKYRGQVLSDSKQVTVEVHIISVEHAGQDIVIRAGASLWKDALRIYEFKNVGVRITSTLDR
ncbi:MAG: PfaB family protein [Chloroflexi bacterium]|nr:PfaB family protein [Chloroflexota bacterium]